jgi:hypothetical protein
VQLPYHLRHLYAVFLGRVSVNRLIGRRIMIARKDLHLLDNWLNESGCYPRREKGALRCGKRSKLFSARFSPW